MSVFQKNEHQVYFLYGSNMNPTQIKARSDAAKRIGIGYLAGHQLAFFGHSSVWDGGEETLVASPGNVVWGVLYRLQIAAADRFDACQGVKADGSGPYFLSPVEVVAEQAQPCEAIVYRKDYCGEPTPPSRELLAFIVEGALAQGVPPAYIRELQGYRAQAAKYPVPRGGLGERRILPICDGCCP